MRMMALDFGSVTVGVAMTDRLGITAQPAETITRKQENHLRRTCSRITELVSEHSIELIIVGLPLNMDGTEGERAQKSREFAEMIERRTGVKTILWDERLTTVAADELLDEMGIDPRERKKHIDAIAASIILQDYMNSGETHER